MTLWRQVLRLLLPPSRCGAVPVDRSEEAGRQKLREENVSLEMAAQQMRDQNQKLLEMAKTAYSDSDRLLALVKSMRADEAPRETD